MKIYNIFMKNVSYVAKTFKNSELVKLMEYLENGGKDSPYISEQIAGALDYIEHKYDCCDFRIACLVRILYKYGNLLSKETYSAILKTTTQYPYTDQGSTSICSWSENHRLCINSSGYLLGALDNSLTEVNSNQNLFELCKKQLYIIGNDILKYGIKEFSSNTYYPVSMSSIANIIEFSKDEELIKLYTCVLDLYVFDCLALSMPDNTYNPANARSYIDNKTNMANHMLPIVRALKGEKISTLVEDETCFICFLNAGKYAVPKVFLEINKLNEKEITLSNSQDIAMLLQQGYGEYDEDKVRLLMQQGLFSDYRFIDNTVRYIKEHGMENHPLFKYLRRYIKSNKKSLYETKRRHFLFGDSSYIGKGNSYTYSKGNYQLSHLNNYHTRLGASQQSTNMINIDGITSFSLVPYKNKKKTGGRNYWTGGLRNAHWSGEKNVLLGIYDLKFKKHYSHLYFPVDLFDEVDLSHLKNGYLFGRYHGTNIMVKANSLALVNSKNDNAIKVKVKMDNFHLKKYDFRNISLRNHYYIYKVDDSLSFSDFINDELNKKIAFDGRSLVYDNYSLVFGDGLYKNKEKAEKTYRYLTNDFCHVKNNIACFELNGKTLTINLKNYERKTND